MKQTEKFLRQSVTGNTEPVFEIEPTRIEFIQALNWYKYSKTYEDAGKYFYSLYPNNPASYYTELMIKGSLSLTFAWIARMIVNSSVVPEEEYKIFHNKTKYLEERIYKPKISQQKKTILSTNERINDIVGDIEEYIDLNNSVPFTDWLISQKIPLYACPIIIEKYEGILEEYKLIGKDEQITEGYSRLKPTKIKNSIKLYKSIVDSTKSYLSNKGLGALRTRKTSIPKANRKVSQFRYQKEFNNIVSLDPKRIATSREVWFYNTENNNVYVYKAEKDKTLDIELTKILNVDLEKSFCIALGVQTDMYLTKIKQCAKGYLARIFEGKKIKSVTNSKSKETMIILRIER